MGHFKCTILFNICTISFVSYYICQQRLSSVGELTDPPPSVSCRVKRPELLNYFHFLILNLYNIIFIAIGGFLFRSELIKLRSFFSQTTRTYLNISRRNTRSFQIHYKTNKSWFKKFQGRFLDGGASILYSGTRKENWRESQRQKRLREKIGKNWRGFFKKCAKVIYSLGQRRKFEECLCKHDIRKQERRSNVSRKLLNNYVTRIFLEHYKHYLKINKLAG